MLNKISITSRSPAIEVTDAQITGGVSYEQCCNNDNDIVVGNTVSTKLEFETFFNFYSTDEFTFSQKQEGYSAYETKGKFKVYEIEKLSNEPRYKITAYDNVNKFDKDIKSNYDSYWQSSPTPTVGTFFSTLCSWVGCTAYSTSFTNSTLVMHQKPVDGTQINGRELLGYIAAVAGGFIIAESDGKIRVKHLAENSNVPYFNRSLYKNMNFADLTVPQIAVVRVASGDSDTGISYPPNTTGQTLTIPFNAIFYNESSATMQSYVQNIYNVVHAYTYVPVEMNLFCDRDANGYTANIGDKIQFQVSSGVNYYSYVFTKKVTPQGVYIKSTGSLNREIKESTDGALIQLNQKYNNVKNTVDEHTREIGVVGPDENLRSLISQNATDITLRVQKNDVISQINLSSESATINANRINLSGVTTFVKPGDNVSTLTNDSGYTNQSQVTTICGNTITTGYVNALHINANSLTVGNQDIGSSSTKLNNIYTNNSYDGQEYVTNNCYIGNGDSGNLYLRTYESGEYTANTRLTGTGVKISGQAEVPWSTIVSGGGGEPAAYIKNASVSNGVLTLTKKDNTTVTYQALFG